MDSTLRSVCEAVHAIGFGDGAVRTAALRALEAFQRRPEAWSAAMALLTTRELSPLGVPPVSVASVRFFAAQTLKMKATVDSGQLGPLQPALSTLWPVVLGGAHDEQWGAPVSRQLVAALAGLIVQYPVDVSGGACDPLLADVFKTAGDALSSMDAAGAHVAVLALDVCGCVAQALGDTLIHVPPQRRDALYASSAAAVGALADVLTQTGVTDDASRPPAAFRATGPLAPQARDAVCEASLKALSEWLHHVRVPGSEGSGDLFSLLFAASSRGMASGSDALSVLARLSRGRASQSAIPAVSRGLLVLVPAALERLQSNGLLDSTAEHVFEVCAETVLPARAALDAVDAFGRLLVVCALRGDELATNALEASVVLARRVAVECRAVPLVEDALVVWCTLARCFVPFDRAQPSEDGEVSSEDEETIISAVEPSAAPWAIPTFEALFIGLVTAHLAIPPGAPAEHRDFRHAVGDALKDCARVIGGEHVLSLAVSGVAEHVGLVGGSFAAAFYAASGERISPADLPEGAARALDALLFAMRTVAMAAADRTSDAPAAAVDAVLRLLRAAPDALGGACALVLGCFAEWMSPRAPLAMAVLSALGQAYDAAPVHCARAARYVCESCASGLSGGGDALPALYSAALRCASGSTGDAQRAVVDACEAAANVASETRTPAETAAPYVRPWLDVLASGGGPVALALECVAAFADVVGAADARGFGPLGTSLAPRLIGVVAGHTDAAVVGEAATLACVLVRRLGVCVAGDVLGLAKTIVERMPGSTADGLRIVRAVADHSGDDGAVRAAASAAASACALPVFMESADVRRQCLAALSSVLDAGVCSPALDEQCVCASLAAIAHDGAIVSSSDAASDEAARAEALLLLARLLRRRPAVPAAIDAIGSVWRALSRSLLPPTLHNDVASVLRRAAATTSADDAVALFASAALAPLGLSPTETAAWAGRYASALSSTRPRDLRETVTAFCALCDRCRVSL